MADGTVLR